MLFLLWYLCLNKFSFALKTNSNCFSFSFIFNWIMRNKYKKKAKTNSKTHYTLLSRSKLNFQQLQVWFLLYLLMLCYAFIFWFIWYDALAGRWYWLQTLTLVLWKSMKQTYPLCRDLTPRVLRQIWILWFAPLVSHKTWHALLVQTSALSNF